MCETSKILSASGSIVSFVSNGSLLTEEKARKLLSSGITRGQISLDGAKAESYEKLRGIKGSFDKAVDAIKILKKVGFKDVEIAFCPTSFNISEIEQTFLFCKDLGVNSFRVQPLMLLGRGNLYRDSILPSYQQYRELVRIINKLKDNFSFLGNIQIEYGDPVDHLIRFSTIMEHCNTFVGVKADGSIQASPYIPITIGNIRRYKFSEYWNAGLAKMWEIPNVKELARKIVSVKDMGRKHSDIPIVWLEEDIELDIIDDNLLGSSDERSKTCI